jgi:hypothetical protein
LRTSSPPAPLARGNGVAVAVVRLALVLPHRPYLSWGSPA